MVTYKFGFKGTLTKNFSTKLQKQIKIKIYNRNQVGDKIEWRLSEGFYLFIQVLSANNPPLSPRRAQKDKRYTETKELQKEN